MKTDLIIKQQLEEILEGLKKNNPDDEDIDGGDDIENVEPMDDPAGARVKRGVANFFSKKGEDEPANVKNLVKHGGYNIANAASKIPGLLLGKDNIFFKAANFMKNPDIVELFKWSSAKKKSKDYPYEPMQGDSVFISNLRGAKKYRLEDTVANLYGKIDKKKLSAKRSYFEIKIIYPRPDKSNIIGVQLDFSLLRLGPGKLFLLLKNGRMKGFPVRVESRERNKWNVYVQQDMDINSMPESPLLDDTSAIAATGMLLNGYLEIKDWKVLGSNISPYFNLLVKIATVLKDPRTKNKVLKQINDTISNTKKSQEYLDIEKLTTSIAQGQAKKIALLTKNLQTAIPALRAA